MVSLGGSVPATTIGTTQILQLFGIGNADALKALNIPVLIDNLVVGAKPPHCEMLFSATSLHFIRA